MKKYKPLLIALGAFAVLIVLFMLPSFLNSGTGTNTGPWAAAGISCINGDLQLSQHFHPNLKIFVDGKEELVPANIGLTPLCAAEVHTHPYGPDDPQGTLHIETPFAEKKFKLAQFFVVWGKTIERPGFAVSMTVDGKPNTDLGALILADKQQIVLKYIK